MQNYLSKSACDTWILYRARETRYESKTRSETSPSFKVGLFCNILFLFSQWGVPITSLFIINWGHNYKNHKSYSLGYSRSTHSETSKLFCWQILSAYIWCFSLKNSSIDNYFSIKELHRDWSGLPNNTKFINILSYQTIHQNASLPL